MFSSPSSLPSTVELLTRLFSSYKVTCNRYSPPTGQLSWRNSVMGASGTGNTSIIDHPPPKKHPISYIVAFKVILVFILVLRCRDDAGVSYRHGLLAGVFNLLSSYLWYRLSFYHWCTSWNR
ncbi:uncharacterized protein HD556DRAFT_1352373 [Suillus plorans]|uniref:Uncharacterized protein n=1 Tax=Suillus plorans TaxID=116603 RepID=A0A9P7J0B9_9AGAM|nr:uncharacterized protein HD556DRAFT_1352373 [Suillus plorans]KAG1798662.1 hypothetical protein HD556DRAFT_1352373 [Suillus plorans]